MKKIVTIDEDDAKFLADYKKSHGITPSKFIDLAIREKIIKTKFELSITDGIVVKDGIVKIYETGFKRDDFGSNILLK